MDSILYVQKMKQFIIRKGKKNVIENRFEKFLTERAIANKGNFSQILIGSILNSVPYIKLRSRRKGTRFLHKIGFLEKEESMRKGLLAFSKKLTDINNGNFLRALDQELISLSTGKSTIMTKRDELHKTAVDNMPFS